MPTQIRSREECVEAIIDKHGADMQDDQLRDDAKNPKRFFVGEYDSDDLVALSTVDTLDDAEARINESESLNVQVIDLDTGREHHVSWIARVER